MKKIYFSLIFLLTCFIGFSQTSTTNRYISGTAYPAEINFFDENFQDLEAVPISTFGSNSTSHGVFLHPITKELYTVLREDGSSSTSFPSLYKVNPLNGTTTLVMTLTVKYSMLDMADNGKIYGVVGNGSTNQGELYEIDPIAQTEILKINLGLISGTKRTLGINPIDQKIYVFYAELWNAPKFDSILKVDLTTFAVQRTLGNWDNLQISGATYYDTDTFLLSSYDSFFAKYNIITNTIATSYTVNSSQLDAVKINLIKPIAVTSFCGNTSFTIETIYDGNYEWYRNGALIVGANLTSLTTTMPGTYQALATINSTTNSIWSEPIILTTLTYPTVSINSNPGLTICSGQTTTLTASSGGTSQWYLNGSAISGAITNTFVASLTGTYNMIKTNTNQCKDSASVGSFVQVNSAPVTPIITGNLGVCANATGEVYFAPNNAGSTYTWTVPAGATITSTPTNIHSITVDFGNSAGNISVSETNSCGTANQTVGVTILTTPTTLVYSGSAVVCPSATGIIYSVNGPGNSTYAWTVTGGTQISGTNTSTITVDWGATAGSLSVIETNACSVAGSPSTYSVTASTTPNTSAITGVSAVCPNATGVNYSVVNTQGSTYAWTVPASATIVSTITNTNSIAVNWNATPSGTITVVETTACGTGSAVSYTVTNGTPAAPTVSSPLDICINSTASALTATGSNLKWYTTAVTTVSASSITPSTAAAGSTDYFVSQTVGGCESPRATLTVNVGCVGIEERNNPTVLTIYPNPTNGVFTIELNNNTFENTSFELVNLSGQVITAKNISSTAVTTIDLSDVAKGIYFVKISNNETTLVKKLILK